MLRLVVTTVLALVWSAHALPRPETWLASFRNDEPSLSCEEISSHFASENPDVRVLKLISSGRTCIARFERVGGGAATAQAASPSPSPRASELKSSYHFTIEPDTHVRIAQAGDDDPVPVPVPYSWGLDRIDQTNLPLDGEPYDVSTHGKGAHVYLLDTGIYAVHSEFELASATQGPDFNGEDGTDQDLNGHGTHVASTIMGQNLGVGKDIALTSVKVLNKDGVGFMSDVIEAMFWVLEQAQDKQSPAIITMSLAGDFSQAMNDAVQEATDAGHLVVVAAGNNDKDACQQSPSSAASAITIGATDKADQPLPWTNFGSCVDVYAPGERIVGASHMCTNRYIEKSGTSMATPFVAGMLGILLEKHSFDRLAAVEHLQNMSLPVLAGNDTILVANLGALDREPEPELQGPQICVRDSTPLHCLDFVPSRQGPVDDNGMPIVAEAVSPPDSHIGMCRGLKRKDRAAVKDKVLLVSTGWCSFQKKMKYAQNLGVKAVLFYPQDDSEALTEPTYGSKFDIKVPSAMISLEELDLLQDDYAGMDLIIADFGGKGTDEPTPAPTEEEPFDCATLEKAACKDNDQCVWRRRWSGSMRYTCKWKK